MTLAPYQHGATHRSSLYICPGGGMMCFFLEVLVNIPVNGIWTKDGDFRIAGIIMSFLRTEDFPK